MSRFFLIVAVLMCSAFILTEVSAQPDSKAWQEAKSTFTNIEQSSPVDEGVLLFTGSSSIAMWRTIARDISPLPYMNRAISGTTLEEWAANARSSISEYKPAAVIIYAGDNDIAQGRTAEQVLESFKRFTTELRKDLPTTPIVFLSIKPSPSRWSKWETMKKANELVKNYISKGKNLVYVDTGSTLLDKGGVVRPELFLKDGLHMNEAGYRNWAVMLKPVLKDLYAAYRAQGNKTTTKMPRSVFLNNQ